ncbi:MAG: TIGR02147 family protein [Fibromonadales bacterium]|nr:TIGR02147 family protein [Fibromonadales bacterium]
MPSVFAYSDYRTFMCEAFAEKKASSRFSWREFAKRAGYASPVFLKLVAEKKSSLSTEGIERVGLALGLTDKEQDFFRLLVAFTHETNNAKKQKLFNEMRKIAELCKGQIVEANLYDYYKEWHHSVIRELAANVSSESEISKLLVPKIPMPQVKASIALLLKLGLLEKDSEGSYRQTNKHLTTGENVSSMAVRKHHENMANLAVTALERISKEERDVSGITMGLSKKGFEAVKAELANFRRRIKEIAMQSENEEESVYRMNLQLFPLSKTTRKKEGKK